MIVRRFKINMVPGGKTEVVNISQYDFGDVLEFELYSSEGTFVVESGTTATIRGTKPDGNGISLTADLESTQDPSTGLYTYLVTVEVIQQMTAVAGKSTYEISLQKNGQEINTANFVIDVERAPLDADTLPSESVIKELVDVIDQADEIIQAAEDVEAALNTIDPTLSIEGRAADAKATGDEIADIKADLSEIIDSSIKSSNAPVITASNYTDYWDDINNQPINTIHVYDSNVYSYIANMPPSTHGITIMHYTPKKDGIYGRVMLAVDLAGDNRAVYFRAARSSSGSALWTDWVKVANSADVEIDVSLSISGKPADAKATGDTIKNVKTDLEDETGVKNIDFISGYWTNNTDGGVATLTSPYADFVCAIAPCQEGDIITINLYGASAARAYAYLDSEYRVLAKGGKNVTYNDQIIDSPPAGTAYVTFNNRITNGMPSGYYARIGKYPTKAIQEITDNLSQKTVVYKKLLSNADDVNEIIVPGLYDITNDGTETWKPINWPLDSGGNLVVFGNGESTSTIRKTQVIFTKKELIFRIGLGGENWNTWIPLTEQTVSLEDCTKISKGKNDIISSLSERIIKIEQENGINVIPSYYETHIADKISAINNLRPVSGDQFIFITDTHIDGYAHGNAMNSHALINELCKKTLISKVFNGGDILTPNSNTDIIKYIDCIRRGINYSQSDTLARSFYIGGNHDLGASKTAIAELTAKQLARLSNLYSSDELDIKYSDVSPFLYCIDDNEKEIRYIVNCEGMISGSGYTGHTWWESDGITHTKCCKYFVNALKATPTGYHIVVLNHISGIPTSSNTDTFAELADETWINYLYRPFVAYQQKTTYTNGTISADFSDASGIPVCMIFGHSHRDVTGISSDIKLSGVSIGGTIPLFITTTDNPNASLDQDATRTIGTVSEQAFDVFTIDKAERKIYITRIGGGNDRTNDGNGYSY